MLSEKRINFIFSIVALVLMWGVWVLAHIAVKNEYIIPSFQDVVINIGENLSSLQFWNAFARTLGRTLYAWGVAFLCAVGLVSIGIFSAKFRRLLAPFISVLRTLPTMAITLMLLIWTNPRIAPVYVTFLMLFPLMYSQLLTAYGEIDPSLVQMITVYKVRRRDRLLKVYIPLMMPAVLSQMGANLSLSLKVMISAEVLAGTFRSIGGMMYDAAMYSRMDQMFSVTIMMLVTGGVLEYIFGRLTFLTARWRGKNSKKRRRAND